MNKPIRIIEDKKYPNMYRLQWKNLASERSVDGARGASGDISIRTWEEGCPKRDGYQESYGMFNKTRALDILKNYAEYKHNLELRKNNGFYSPNIDAD